MVAALANKGIPVGYFLFGAEQHGFRVRPLVGLDLTLSHDPALSPTEGCRALS
jgi:hypothetical protein